jgi:hypothetical protein
VSSVDASAAVFDRTTYVGRFRRVRADDDIAFRSLGLSYRLQGVDHEVHDDLLQLRAVSMHPPLGARWEVRDPYAARLDLLSQEQKRFADDVI